MQSSQPTLPIIHAPEDIGFTHATVDQFTHFSGSEAGARETYGLSVTEISKLIVDFAENFIRENKSEDAGVNKVFKELSGFVSQVKRSVDDFKSEKLYASVGEIAEGIQSCGHIPIILSKGLAAGQYGRAGRQVVVTHVETYLNMVSGAKEQAREFLVKQDIMKMMVGARKKLFQTRYHTPNPSPAFFMLNKLIAGIDKIIMANQKSMPTNCEQFDLFETFRLKIFKIINAFDPKITDQGLNSKIRNLFFKYAEGNVYPLHKALSDGIYSVLIDYVTQAIGMKQDSEESYLNEKQAAMLQDILPLVDYLNSSQNPFARLGLFGKEITTNDFHNRALAAYQLHESRVDASPYSDALKSEKELKSKNGNSQSSERKDGDQPKPVKVVYDADQIDQLLYGPPEDQKKDMGASDNFLSRLGNSIKGLLTENSAGSQSARSQSAQRQKLLALPVPTQYLMLEAPKNEEAQGFVRRGNGP